MEEEKNVKRMGKWGKMEHEGLTSLTSLTSSARRALTSEKCAVKGGFVSDMIQSKVDEAGV